MAHLTDQQYLKEQQYKDSQNLNARVIIHERFSTNPINWQRWVWEQLPLQQGMKVLEVGSGPGLFWRENKDRLAGLEWVLGDLSVGMVQEARAAICSNTFVNMDVQAIPLASESFDLVIANHMLYHVPQINQALKEIWRVLKPKGQLCAATNGVLHLQELFTLAATANPRLGNIRQNFGFISNFNLQNAPAILRAVFKEVQVKKFENGLWVTESQPLANYVLSMTTRPELAPSEIDALKAYFQALIQRDGGIKITKETGVTLALKA